ncbi:fatty acyl-CoA reductase 1-like, partial [Schistocerca piceifrons]|uniref:fatty acyl-CoA reductase 1-like n=1 Tax=Schistocerca piceifrons TaxID=274613 RepID=UPI001F5E4A35
LPADWWPPGVLEQLSRVAAFYDGAPVFLTGATGFVGTLVLEKLLRSCPGASTVYVLVMDKKDVPLRERLRSHLDNVVLSKAREACPDYLRKVVAVAGDCTQPELGISPADAAELTGRVSVVFHVAATVRFDADLRTATSPTLAPPARSLHSPSYMPHIKAFVYMSTAYAHAPRDEIDEKFYPPALKAEELLKLIGVMDDEQLAQIFPLLMGDWPNTYTFTKAIAEDLIRSEAVGLPASIIRPSIVSSTYQEPLALWVGNMYGPTAAGAESSVGLLHAMHMDRSALVDGVPADMVANATLACAWDTWLARQLQERLEQAAAPTSLLLGATYATLAVTTSGARVSSTYELSSLNPGQHEQLENFCKEFGDVLIADLDVSNGSIIEGWQLRDQFLAEEFTGALEYDAAADTHPMTTEENTTAPFDDITNNKGGSILRMFSNWLGEDVFYERLNEYLISQ